MQPTQNNATRSERSLDPVRRSAVVAGALGLVCAGAMLALGGSVDADDRLSTTAGSTAGEADVLAAMGACAGDAAYDAHADLNRDGCVNALDIAVLRGGGQTGDGVIGDGGIAGGGETLSLDEPNLILGQGGTGSVLVLIDGNTTPLFGYSLDVDVTAEPGAVGDVFTEVRLTNY
ncbi:MAG: hypothetical protein ACYTGR_20050 [Planctomycetota bacterium]|jgi:hypothetical protein